MKHTMRMIFLRFFPTFSSKFRRNRQSGAVVDQSAELNTENYELKVSRARKEKPPTVRWGVSRNPAATYSPRRGPPSTIGAGGLNCRVRNGNGCDPTAKTTGNCALGSPKGTRKPLSWLPERFRTSTSIIGIQALGRLVPVS